MDVNIAKTGTKGVINGPVLDAVHWLMSISTIHPSMHRFKNALGITVGMISGDNILALLTGYHADGTMMHKNTVPAPLRDLHGLLHYNYHSDDDSERVKRMAHIWTIIGMGGAGAFLGSHDYSLNDQPIVGNARKAFENPKNFTLNLAEDLHVARQSEMWRKMSGVSGTLGSSSGLQLFPGIWNYGTDLSMSFFGTVRRNKTYMPGLPWLQKLVTGSDHPYPFGPSSLCDRLKNYLVANPDANPIQARPMAEGALEMWFGERVTDAHVDAFLKPVFEARNKVFKPGGVPAAAKPELEKALSGLLLDEGLEKHLRNNVKLDPATAMIGRGGMMERMPRMLGAGGRLVEVEQQFYKGYAQRHGLALSGQSVSDALNAATRAADRNLAMQGFLAMGGIAAMVGGLAYIHRNKTKPYQMEAQTDTDVAAAAATPVSTETAPVTIAHDAYEKNRQRNVLEAAERVTNMVNMPMSFGLHRAYCAAGLTFGGYVGSRLGDVVAGRTLAGAVLPKEKVPEFLKFLYNKRPYNPMSDHAKDKWGFVAHFGVPAVTGVGGVILASNLFFASRKRQVESADFLDEYEKKISMAQGNAYTPVVAAFAFPVAPSPFAYMPFLNYGTALGSRFMLTSGRKVVTPGIGAWWTNSTSRFAQGPAELLDVMIDYVTDSPNKHPEQLRDMVVGILPQWFPEVTPKQIDRFVQMVEQEREKHCVNGAVPEKDQEKCRDALKARFKHGGLEARLREIDLDPARAMLANNGLVGKIALQLGAKKKTELLQEEFVQKYTERLEQEKQAKTCITPEPSAGYVDRLAREPDPAGVQHRMGAA